MKWSCMLLWLCLAAPLAAAEYHAKDPGEVAAAVKLVQPGDVIVLADGPWRDADLVFEAQGSPVAPITLRAATPGKLVLSGASRVRIAGSYLVVEGLYFRQAFHSDDLISLRRDSKQLAHHCRVTQCAIIDCNPSERKTESHWVSLYGAHNRFDHCLLQGKTNVGTMLVVWLPTEQGEPNQHQIDHNYFGPRPELKKNGGETIRIGDSKTSMQTSRTLVESNVFEQCDGEIETVSNKSCENVYRGNTFLRCSGTITLRHGNRCLVEGNFFLGQKARGSGGVRIIGEDHRVTSNYFAELEGDDTRAALSMMNGIPDSPLNGYFQVKRAIVKDNVFVNCKQTFVLGIADKDAKNRLPPQDSTISGNVVVARRGPIVDLQSPVEHLLWKGNVFSGSELGITSPADGWTRVEMKLVERDGLAWPDHPSAGGPKASPIARRDVGPSWSEQ